ncbi:cytochrome P450 [Streptomyces indiaensis]|uniref:Cytochrome P450 n=1 Tax=Streptomyces indiaensis TaxID=284033 RepID=A0ABN3DYH8_9ACTN|nr:cytochrome P450 [Streptomyces indiaensis]MCF1646488.1 cytochrome P450 [Streptomyces indiaensis]
MTLAVPTPEVLIDPELHATGDPHALWRWMRDHRPVYWHNPGALPGFWSLTRYEDVRAVCRDPGTFSSEQGIVLRPESHGKDPGGGRTLALTDPPRHRQLRAVVADWFTTRSVRSLEGSMRGVVRSVIARAVEEGGCDFVTDVAARLPLYVICHLMGVPEEDREKLFQLASVAFGTADPVAQSAAHQEIMQHFVELMYQRMEEPADDLVSALVNSPVDGELLPEDDILLNCDNLLVGGTENVRLATSGGMLALLERPEEWQRLAADPGLLPTAVEEILRWTSSANVVMRVATAPTVIEGQRIEAGDRLMLWIPSANRDERVFTDPDRFDCARRPNRHLALGAGEHFCLGSLLARTEMRVLFRELLDMAVRVEQTGPAVPVRSIVVNGLESLPVRIVPR